MSSREQAFLAGIEYLMEGNPRQREVYQVLRRLGVMEVLAPYRPALVGTIPLDVDIPGSDLDVVCHVKEGERETFGALLQDTYGSSGDFEYAAREVDGLLRQVGRFRYEGWAVEIFGQVLPVEEQNGYRHMVVEHRLLGLLGDRGREAIRRLKLQRFKTEPAFAQLLRLKGDPYRTLLDMYHWSPEQLAALAEQVME